VHHVIETLDKQFWSATVAAFVTSVVLNFLVHGVFLASDYAAPQNVYRPPGFDARFVLIFLAQLSAAGAMTALYRFGIEPRPYLGQGLRFGLLVAGASVIPSFLIGYAVTNITGALAIKQLILGTIVVTAMGIVIAWFYRK
jgi:hypothetical protein